MTEQEALKVIFILKQADNGCPHCVRILNGYFVNEFPRFSHLIDPSDIDLRVEHIAAYKSLNDDEQAECDRLINELEGSQQTPGAIGEIIAQILLRRVL